MLLSSYEGTNNSEKTYKQLKKKKESWDKDFTQFKQQMDHLLSHHENYLLKKN